MADDSISAPTARKSTARKHGHAFAKATTREYRIWCNMRQRCNNPKASHYERYGGRGITVCDRWSDFSAFLADMGHCPSPSHSLDRVDNNGPYSPDNCRWATQVEQLANSTRVKLVEWNGEFLPTSKVVRLAGISPQTFYRRIAEGWTVEQALAARPYAKRRKEAA